MKKFGLVATVAAVLFTVGCGGGKVYPAAPEQAQTQSKEKPPLSDAEKEKLWDEAFELLESDESDSTPKSKLIEPKRKF